MSFPSSAVTHRQIVLFCARLFVQCVLGWSTSQIGIDEAKFRHHASDQLVARHEAAEAGSSFKKWKPYQTV
ncbi:hypothetical protein SAMN05444170_2950 [Bradyrhizobium erythrophlei]|jgi:hypothetical protein|uniref:Uncharacterized protein n=1 Tax=Bradyrhizobium erythrophlei TaxID=1437360 RepID=A0A1M7TXG9_9BRAD|nr:hypothetical protein SAMN05444170_2950 [Bradyrhizobium erythrophlei]